MLLTVSFGKTDPENARPLTPKEWGEFAVWLNERDLAPEDLLKGDLPRLLGDWHHPKVTGERIETLLSRGATLGFALEKWQRAGLWVLMRSDPEYPKRLKHHLGWKAPAVLFGCGNKNLLSARSVAVVGSRHADDADIRFAESVGRQAAESGILVVSGGAAGVDQAAMLGALDAEGTAIGILADSLLRSSISAKYRKHLMSGDLALISPFNPEVRFLVGNAMARNKYIYCLAHDAIVVSSTPNNGGTWNGAIENLKRGWVPLWVKQTETPGSGNPQLVELGGRWLENLDDPAFATQIYCRDSGQESNPNGDASCQLPGVGQEESSDAAKQVEHSLRPVSSGSDRPNTRSREIQQSTQGESIDFAEELYRQVRLLAPVLCAEPKRAGAIADALGVTKPTADAWIRRLVQERILEKIANPVRYVTRERDLIG